MADVAALRQLGRRMQTILMTGVIVLLAGLGWAVVEVTGSPGGMEEAVRQGLSASGPLTFSPAAIAAAGLVAAAQLALLGAALYCVWRMFGAFAAEEPLSIEPAVWMRRAGLAFVFLAAGGVLARSAIYLALTLGNPAGQRALSIGLGSGEMLTLLIASIMYMISRVLKVAAEVRADQKGFV